LKKEISNLGYKEATLFPQNIKKKLGKQKDEERIFHEIGKIKFKRPCKQANKRNPRQKGEEEIGSNSDSKKIKKKTNQRKGRSKTVHNKFNYPREPAKGEEKTIHQQKKKSKALQR